ncbi:MFS transporter [Streptomyces sp. ADI98-10]|uniref:MFS transporter n=1 Tax=Streptomyces sp. ADI98-10 TaxID=1522763 RepID=UPI002405EECA|nr:MFS transporter [Streptomyces sp. ADI98-10]
MTSSLLDHLHSTTPAPAGALAPVPHCARRPAQLVGRTPVLWIDEPFAPAGLGFHAKLEGVNPGGIKDRSALHMIREARRRGDLTPGAGIVESSGCALRTVAFGLLGFVDSLPALIAASAATGLAGALFNPVVRAYLAAEAGEERRVDAFATFNVFYQAGILIGPLAGLALLMWDFTVVCAVAATIFGALALLQWRALPSRPPVDRDDEAALRSVERDWRTIASNRPFLLFAVAMTGSYVLAFQVYLALPLRARDLFGDRSGLVTGAVFAVSALAALSGQLRLTAWAKRTLAGPTAIAWGLALMGIAFLPLLPSPPGGLSGKVFGVAALTACAALLAWGGALLYPFEMDTIVRLTDDRMVATYYGAYNTVSGIAIPLGNLAVGALFDTGVTWLPWAALTATGLTSAAMVTWLHHTGHLVDRAAYRAVAPV